MHCLLVRLPAVLLALVLAACGGSGDGSGPDTLSVASRSPDTGDIRDEMLTPSTLKDPRIEQLSRAEQRILQSYVRLGLRRDSLEDPQTPDSLRKWLDSNLTVGQVIALYRGAEKVEPLPPGEQPQSPTRVPGEQE